MSIVVAVYNAEKFIHKCVDSLLAQTYPHLEVILVDDGSPDRCGAICDEYAARDNRVKVYHQPNGGVAVARQTGIDHATGDYVIHADPDDWVEPNMIEELLANALETGADMVVCDHFLEKGKVTTYRRQNCPPGCPRTPVWGIFQWTEPLSRLRLSPSKGIKFFSIKFQFV